MESEWEYLTIEDIAEHQKGLAFKSKDYLEQGYPVIRVSNFTSNSISSDDLRFVSKEVAAASQNVELLYRDVIIATVGSWPKNPSSIVGKVVRVPKKLNESLLNQNAVRMRVKSAKNSDQGYLYYLLKNKDFSDYIVSTAQGSANQASITLKDIYKYKVLYPPQEERHLIANILGSLDNKIEINRQMNQTLEAMAQALFKSWFVDFDPVIDNALEAGSPIPEPLQNRAQTRQALRAAGDAKPLPQHIQKLFPNSFTLTDEMGWVPEGWGDGRLYDLCEKITDGAHQSPPSVAKEEGFPMASAKDLTNEGIELTSCRFISKDKFIALKNNGCNPVTGDVLISKDGSRCGETCCIFSNNIDIVLLSSIAIIRPNRPELSSYIRVFLSRNEVISDLRENYVSGSAIPRIVLRDFKRLPIIIPSTTIIDQWSKLLQALYSSKFSSIQETNTLENLRDTLLPKLISGELRIPEAEAHIKEAVA